MTEQQKQIDVTKGKASFLALFFGRFKFIRKLTGGLWILSEVPEINFKEWVWLDEDLCEYFDKYCNKEILQHEDYR